MHKGQITSFLLYLTKHLFDPFISYGSSSETNILLTSSKYMLSCFFNL